MSEGNDIIFEFGIRTIKPLGFEVNDLINYNSEDLLVTYGLDFSWDIEENLVNFVINARFFDNSNNNTIIYSKVLTQFYVKDLSTFLNHNKELELPNQGLLSMFSISFTHLRAIQATYTNGTILKGYLIPIINPSDVLKNILEVAKGIKSL